MKNLTLTIVMACIIFAGNLLRAQEIGVQLSNAQSAYKAGNLQDTRFALQQALGEIDKAIGAEILKLLPTNMGKMAAVVAEDNVAGSGFGFAGLYVNRTYKTSETMNASLQIISDSPMLAGINTLLALPAFAFDPSQKKIKIGNYRALLQKSTDESGNVSWDVQIPFSSSLLTLHCMGVNEEKEVTEMANTIPIDKISKFVQ
ncbi:MAG: hypothetical protein U1C46_09140 [Bacteroidales bacterium]|nr:hypothetical protein [Bacteroidales bacterium]MDZ4204969.1 hypothetical protein [Bacteroidales bacterium]